MSIPISTRTRSLLARSLAPVRQRRDLLAAQMERSLAAAEGDGGNFGQAEGAGTMLVDLLLGQVKRLVESGGFGSLGDVADAHHALGITGRHYSRFGDALVPALRDLLGPTTPREVAGAWCDAFWAIVVAQEGEAPVEGNRSGVVLAR